MTARRLEGGRSTGGRFPAGEGLGRSSRLRKTRDFAPVQRQGRRHAGRHLVLLERVNELGAPRIGLAVSRKVGNAVVRNRVKRWLREAFRRVRARLPAIDVVAIARPSAAEAGYAAIRDEVDAFAAAVHTRTAG